MIAEEDLSFLASLEVAGMFPRIMVNALTAQWDIPGFNFGDRCFQAVLVDDHETQGRKIIVQVLRRPHGSSDGQYTWVALGSVPYRQDDSTRRDIERLIIRWGGLRKDSYSATALQDIWSFKEWLCNGPQKLFKEATNTSELTALAKAHFGEFKITDRIPRDKISSFLSLPGLREMVPEDQITALVQTIKTISKKKFETLSFQWLLGSLES